MWYEIYLIANTMKVQSFIVFDIQKSLITMEH